MLEGTLKGVGWEALHPSPNFEMVHCYIHIILNTSVLHIMEGVANGKIRDSPRCQDPSKKSEPETLW